MSDFPQIVGVGHNCLDYLCTVEAYSPEDGSTHITSIAEQGGGAAATAVVISVIAILITLIVFLFQKYLVDHFDGLYRHFAFAVYEGFERRRYFDIIESKNY